MTPSPAWTGQHKGETNGEICLGAWRILRRMDLVATDGPSKGGWPCSGGVRPAGDGQRQHVCERDQLGKLQAVYVRCWRPIPNQPSWSATAWAALSQRKQRHDVPNVSRRSYKWRLSCQRTGRVLSTC